jgi:hypothetical protein
MTPDVSEWCARPIPIFDTGLHQHGPVSIIASTSCHRVGDCDRVAGNVGANTGINSAS